MQLLPAVFCIYLYHFPCKIIIILLNLLQLFKNIQYTILNRINDNVMLSNIREMVKFVSQRDILKVNCYIKKSLRDKNTIRERKIIIIQWQFEF